MFGLRGTEIIIIALVILLLFGGKKIPELMKGLGKGIRDFKDEMNTDKKEDDPKKQDWKFLCNSFWKDSLLNPIKILNTQSDFDTPTKKPVIRRLQAFFVERRGVEPLTFRLPV